MYSKKLNEKQYVRMKLMKLSINRMKDFESRFYLFVGLLFGVAFSIAGSLLVAIGHDLWIEDLPSIWKAIIFYITVVVIILLIWRFMKLIGLGKKQREREIAQEMQLARDLGIEIPKYHKK